jgi:aminotransferase in exopolysaccharide biosynthesis
MPLPNNIIKSIRKVVGKQKHHLHEPLFFGNEIKYLKETITTNLVSSVGPFVKKFEDQITKFTKSKYTISVVNGTEALHLSLVACGVKKNDEVLVPTITFVGTANAIVYSGATPHFVDSEFETLGIDPLKLEKYLEKITIKKGKFYFNKKTKRKIKAIIPVHVFGNICQIDKILKIAKKYNLLVIEDAAEALGSFFKNKHAGTFGLVGCFSFNGNKIMTTGGGGAIITNDKLLAKKIKHLSTTAKIDHRWEYIHDAVGYNFRMPNLNAALGSAQIENLNKFLKSKRKLFIRYCKEFLKFNDVRLIMNPEFSKSNNWLNTILIRNSSIKKRNKVLSLAQKNQIFLRPVWKPLHQLKHFRSMPKMNLENAKKIYISCINLPSSSHYFFDEKL